MILSSGTAPSAFGPRRPEWEEFFDTAAVPMHWHDGNGTIRRANQAELDLLGYAREEYVGRNVADFHTDHAVIDDILARLSRGEMLERVPAILRTKSGTTRHVLINASPYVRKGRIEGVHCLTVDVTAERAALQLAAIVDTSDDAIIGKDLDGILTSWNRGAERLFGYVAEEALGKPVTMLIPADLQYEETMILGRIRRGERVEHYETVRRRKDGSIVEVSLSVSPIKDAQGRVIGASKIARDITRRKGDEADLERRIKEQAALYTFVDRLQRTRSRTRTCDAALDAIIAAFDCRRASVLLFDEAGAMRFVAWRGLSSDYRRAFDGHSPWTAGDRNARPVLIGDIDGADVAQTVKEKLRQEGIRALALIPIMANRVVIGNFMIYYDTPHHFADHEVELAVTIARQLCFSLERVAAEKARALAAEELRRNEERLRLATRVGKVGLWEWEVTTGRMVWTDSLYAIYGIEKTSPWMTPAAFETLVHPDDREVVSEALHRALEDDAPYELEFRAVRPDGETIWLFDNALVVRDGKRPVRLAGATLDITERKQAEAQRELLIAELNHRVKNMLAIVQGVAQQTFKGKQASSEERRAFEGRLVNLAAAHNLLTEGSHERACLEQLTADVLQSTAHGQRISVGGPRILLAPKQALAMVMALHELYTNAVKYGALSNGIGTVTFTWRTSGAPDGRLHLEWREQGGPPVSPPKRRGFGSRMVEKALAQDLGGRVFMDFSPEGLVCTIDASLPDNQETAV